MRTCDKCGISDEEISLKDGRVVTYFVTTGPQYSPMVSEPLSGRAPQQTIAFELCYPCAKELVFEIGSLANKFFSKEWFQ